MTTPISVLFKKHLLNEAGEYDEFSENEDFSPQTSKDEYNDFPNDDGDSFKSGVDTDTDPERYKTDSLGFDAEQTDVDNFSEVYDKVYEIKALMSSLIDPANGDNLTRLLANFDRKDSIGEGLLQKLVQPIRKATDSLSSVTNHLDIIASSEEALARRIEGIQQKY